MFVIAENGGGPGVRLKSTALAVAGSVWGGGDRALLRLATKIKNFLQWLKKELRDHPPADTKNDADDYREHGDLPFMWSASKSSSRSRCRIAQSPQAYRVHQRTASPHG
jgi:hypothetical protein